MTGTATSGANAKRYVAPWREDSADRNAGEIALAFPLDTPIPPDEFIKWVWRVSQWTAQWDTTNFVPNNPGEEANFEAPIIMNPRAWGYNGVMASFGTVPNGEEYRLGANVGLGAGGNTSQFSTAAWYIDWSFGWLAPHRWVAATDSSDSYFRPAAALGGAGYPDVAPPPSPPLFTFFAARAGTVGSAPIGTFTVTVGSFVATCGIFLDDPDNWLGFIFGGPATANFSLTATAFYERRDADGNNPLCDIATGDLLPNVPRRRGPDNTRLPIANHIYNPGKPPAFTGAADY